LFNFNDTPEELYERLRINIDLNKELDLKIFSFPMKYIPINAKDRTYIGKHWNRKFLRTIQVILNVTHGAVMPKLDFFEKAFGKNLEEFNRLLLMPEDYIYYRFFAEDEGLTDKWDNRLKFIKTKCNGSYNEALDHIYSNNFRNLPELFLDDSVRSLLYHYQKRIKLKDFNRWKQDNHNPR